MDQKQSALEETEENSSELKKSRSVSSILSSSSSRKSLLRCSTRSSSTITPLNGGLFDDNGAMGSKCHSLTLGTLYVWEQKLYEEVKVKYESKNYLLYSRKPGDCMIENAPNIRGIAVEVEELQSRILVAKRNAESIFKEIRKLRDEELQPQLIELLQGLMKNWKIMSETHETQHRIMSEVRWLKCSSYGKSQQFATQKLQVELQKWRACFAQYVCSQKAYIEALDGWMIKFDAPETEAYSENWSSLRLCRVSVLPTTEICHNWLDGIDKLPYKTVAGAMESFGEHVQALMVQQGKEHQQKRKVDGLAEKLRMQASKLELDKQMSELKLFRVQEDKPHEQKQMKPLKKMENDLDGLENELKQEKAKHHTAMKETHDMYVNGFQKGFSSVFKSLADFSKTSMKIYDELLE
ncbi:hypothetical protein GBA52_025744 [Prunus armeniaca]|nr:hypothetical protein GBA52_025744 [Prunus armeniaca]